MNDCNACNLVMQALFLKMHAWSELAEVAPTPKRPTYRQDWPNYNLAQTNKKSHLQYLLSDLCRTAPDLPDAKTGRKRIPLSAVLFSAVFKIYSTLSTRWFMCVTFHGAYN